MLDECLHKSNGLTSGVNSFSNLETSKKCFFKTLQKNIITISGTWTVALLINNRIVDSCRVDVCDPSQVKVSGLKAGMAGNTHKFMGMLHFIFLHMYISNNYTLTDVLQICLYNTNKEISTISLINSPFLV